MRCVLLRILEAAEGRLLEGARCARGAEVMRRALCMLEATNGELCLLEVL